MATAKFGERISWQKNYPSKLLIDRFKVTQFKVTTTSCPNQHCRVLKNQFLGKPQNITIFSTLTCGND